jgi:lipopolysaccharide exporter
MEERIDVAPPPALEEFVDVDGQAAPVGVERVPAQRTTRAALLVFGLRAASAAAGVVVAALLSRQLGPSGFGELSVIFTVAILASTVAELGTTQVVAAEMAARPSRRRELAAGVAALRVTAGLLLAVAGGLLLLAVLERGTAERAGLAVVATIPLAGISGLVVLHQARLRPQIGAALSLGQTLVWLAAVILGGVLDAPLAFYGLAFLASGAAQAVASWATVKREGVSWSRWRPAARWIVARSWPLTLATVLVAVYYRLDAVLVFELAGPREAGWYAAAYRFLDVLQLVPAALVSVLVPVLARAWSGHDRIAVQRVLRLGVTVTAAVALPVAAGAWVAGERVAVAVFGSDFAPAGAILSVLALAFFSIATGYVYSAMVVATGRIRVLGVAAAIAAAGSVVADLIVIPRWGAVGAAWVTVCVEYFVSSTLAVWIHRRHGLWFPWDRVAAAFGASLVLVAVAWPLRTAPLPVLVGLPALAYVGAAVAFGAITREDVRALAHPTLALGAMDGDSR